MHVSLICPCLATVAMLCYSIVSVSKESNVYVCMRKMVLSIDGSDVYTTVTPQDLDTRYKTLRDPSLVVLARPVRHVGDKDRCLYVGQREMAVIAPVDNMNMIGSEDATTCHIVVIRDKHTGVTGLAHL